MRNSTTPEHGEQKLEVAMTDSVWGVRSDVKEDKPFALCLMRGIRLRPHCQERGHGKCRPVWE